MKSLLIALQFLTRLPILKAIPWSREALSRSSVYFPFVGALLGLGLACGYWLLSQAWQAPVVSLIVVLLWVASTGALHLDGLADTCDVLMSGASREKRLEIMRDPHIGLMGIVAIVFCLLLKWQLLAVLSWGMAVTALIVAPTLGRWACILVSFRMRYARPEMSWVRQFVEQLRFRSALAATVVAGVIAIGALRWWGLLLMVIVGGITKLLQQVWRLRLGGVTGDTIGATCELVELGCLIVISLLS